MDTSNKYLSCKHGFSYAVLFIFLFCDSALIHYYNNHVILFPKERKWPPPLPKRPTKGRGGMTRERSLDLQDRQRQEARRRLMAAKRAASFRQNSATERADSIEIYIPEAQTRLWGPRIHPQPPLFFLSTLYHHPTPARGATSSLLLLSSSVCSIICCHFLGFLYWSYTRQDLSHPFFFLNHLTWQCGTAIGKNTPSSLRETSGESASHRT